MDGKLDWTLRKCVLYKNVQRENDTHSEEIPYVCMMVENVLHYFEWYSFMTRSIWSINVIVFLDWRQISVFMNLLFIEYHDAKLI